MIDCIGNHKGGECNACDPAELEASQVSCTAAQAPDDQYFSGVHALVVMAQYIRGSIFARDIPACGGFQIGWPQKSYSQILKIFKLIWGAEVDAISPD